MHKAQLKMEQEDIEVFINKWELNFRGSLRKDQQIWADKISESLKGKLITSVLFPKLNDDDFFLSK